MEKVEAKEAVIQSEDVAKTNEQEFEIEVSQREESKLRHKQDLIIPPLLALGFFFAYLDRGQIGNARVLGMQKDLGLSAQQYYNIVMMFYAGYMLIELPAALALRYIHPRYAFGLAAIAFGTFAALIPVGRTYASIMVLRFMIGLGEVFIQNAWIFNSLWYRPHELAKRNSIVYCTTPIAGAVSGLIAYAVGRTMEGAHGYTSWEWLFFIEAFLTIGFGCIVLVLMPGLPEDVAEKGHFLFKKREREIIMWRYKRSQNSLHSKARAHQIPMGLKDIKLWLGAFIVGSQGVGIGAFGVFLPTFVNEFGFPRLQTQLISIIPYAFGLVGLILFSWLSDKTAQRALWTGVCLITSIIGFILLLGVTNKYALLAGASFVTAGAYPALVISISWCYAWHGGYTKRSTAVWATQVFIQGYSMIASQVYRNPPRYFLGHGFALGVYVLALICTVFAYFLLKKANKRKDKHLADLAARGEVDPAMEEDYERLCDNHPGYRYLL